MNFSAFRGQRPQARRKPPWKRSTCNFAAPSHPPPPGENKPSPPRRPFRGIQGNSRDQKGKPTLRFPRLPRASQGWCAGGEGERARKARAPDFSYLGARGRRQTCQGGGEPESNTSGAQSPQSPCCSGSGIPRNLRGVSLAKKRRSGLAEGSHRH